MEEIRQKPNFHVAIFDQIKYSQHFFNHHCVGFHNTFYKQRLFLFIF